MVKILDNSISKQVVRALRQQIFSGELKPGERLLEVKIADEMGISRGPVREALLVLEQEGLVVTKPRKGSYVCLLTGKDIREIYTLRALLEGFAVTLFMENITDETMEDLRESLAELKEAVEKKEGMDIARKNMQFHEVIFAHSNHDRLHAAWKSLQVQSRMLSSMTTEYYLDLEDLYKHHVELIEVIQSGDKKRAKRCFEKHILNSMAQLLDSM